MRRRACGPHGLAGSVATQRLVVVATDGMPCRWRRCGLGRTDWVQTLGRFLLALSAVSAVGGGGQAIGLLRYAGVVLSSYFDLRLVSPSLPRPAWDGRRRWGLT
jgi:hypothetical protein